jgi:tellurite resistance protein
MGFSGLTIVYAKAYHILDFSYGVYELMLFVDTILFFLIFGAYLLKWVYYPSEVKAEFNHPVKSAFASAISISFLLLSISYYDYNPAVSVTFWFIGAPLHLYFTYITMKFWIDHTFDIGHISPAWFIPIVGNVLVPVVGVDCMPEYVSLFYFSIGIFFWIVLFVIITYRMIFHHPLAKRLLPTFFILIAPPAVGFISYFRITFGSIDLTSLFLYCVALFTFILMLFMVNKFTKMEFFISWWAYTFPMAAMSIATILLYLVYRSSLLYIGSWVLVVATTLVVVIVSYKTVEAVKEEKICISEEN